MKDITGYISITFLHNSFDRHSLWIKSKKMVELVICD